MNNKSTLLNISNTGNFKCALLGNNSINLNGSHDSWPKLARNGKGNKKGKSVVRKVEPVGNEELGEAQAKFKESDGDISYNPCVKVEETVILSYQDFPTLQDVAGKKQSNFTKLQSSSRSTIEKNDSTDSSSANDKPGNQKLNSDKVPVNKKIPVQTQQKRTKEPITVDLLESLQLSITKKLVVEKKIPKRITQTMPRRSGNHLDSDQPVRKRGKVRAVPKKKKLSAIKNSILLAKQIRQCNAHLKDDLQFQENLQSDIEKCTNQLRQLMWKTHLPNESSTNINIKDEHNKIETANVPFHSRKFRKYCCNTVSKELLLNVEELICSLKRFQDRLHQKDPDKAQRKKRYICGFKQSMKYLRCGETKLIIMPTNLDVREGEPLYVMINDLKTLAKTVDVPIVFGGLSSDLGKWTSKNTKISIVSILNYLGAEEIYKNIIFYLNQAIEDYGMKVNPLANHSSSEISEEKTVSNLSEGSIEEEISRRIMAKLKECT